jgi:HSP20 family protein
MNRVFEDAAVRGWKNDEPSATTSWSPAVDIYETDSEIMVQAELPGVDRKDIALQLENNVLTLKGDRRFGKGNESGELSSNRALVRRIQPGFHDSDNRR